MPATLQLDQPLRAYGPGDAITGHIRYLHPHDHPISLILQFEGRSKSKIVTRDQKNTYRGRHLFCNLRRDLELPPHHDSASFSITIPEQQRYLLPTSRGLLHSYWNTWEASPRHGFVGSTSNAPLPPTFHIQRPSRLGSLEATIHYSLILHTIDPRPPILRPDVAAIRILPAAPPLVDQQLTKIWPSRKLYCLKSLHLLPDYAGRELTWKEHARSLFKPSSLPTFPFILHCDSPNVFAAGAPYSITLRLDVQHHTLSDPPPVLLKLVTLLLRPLASCRVPILLHEFRESSSLQNMAWSAAPNQPFDSTQGMLQRLSMAPLRETVIPSFQGCNVRLAYTAAVEVHLQCASQTFRHAVQHPAVVLGRRLALHDQLTWEAAIEPDEDDVLPSYEEATRW